MVKEKIEKLLANHEKITVEYKESKSEIPENIYETVSSFSNRYGGYIILGVDDNGVPVGMNRNAIQTMKNNFINQLNNPNKMSPTLYIPLEEFENDKKTNIISFGITHKSKSLIPYFFLIIIPVSFTIKFPDFFSYSILHKVVHIVAAI